jgi:hypothetical protein
MGGANALIGGFACKNAALLRLRRLSQFFSPPARIRREILMQQRQLRLGDITDDYCPRERRLTNHAIVAMVGDEIIRTRCTTCDAEHEYKHAAVPRQRRKAEPAALAAPVAVAPKKVAHEPPPPAEVPAAPAVADAAPVAAASDPRSAPAFEPLAEPEDEGEPQPREEGGWGHRTLIRAQLPKHEGQQAVQRQAPDFTIRQPTGGRPGRFRPRQARAGAGAPFQGNRSNQGNRPNQGNFQGGNFGGGQGRGGQRHQGRPHQQQGQGRKRSK